MAIQSTSPNQNERLQLYYRAVYTIELLSLTSKCVSKQAALHCPPYTHHFPHFQRRRPLMGNSASPPICCNSQGCEEQGLRIDTALAHWAKCEPALPFAAGIWITCSMCLKTLQMHQHGDRLFAITSSGQQHHSQTQH